MANPLAKAWDYLTGADLSRQIEQKFTPADPTINWSYVNHLVYTANTLPYGGEGTGDGNSAVYACLLALARASIEPPLVVMKKDVAHGGELEPQPEHPLQAFLDNPNPELDMLELRFWMSWAMHADGNAYLIKVRSGNALTGLPVQLWPVPPTRMEPKTARGSNRLIDYYAYQRYDDGPAEAIPVENVVHFKMGVDPLDPRKGLAGLKRLIREIASDAEATKFMDALLRNFGIPGMVATLPVDTVLNPDQITAMKAKFNEDFGGYGRGKFGVLSGGAKLEQLGFDPDKMNMKVLHDFPETRIAAVMGVDPLVARLGVGLEQTSNYASSKQVRENFTELTLGPIWRMDEAKWNRSLKVDFTDDKTIVVKHDLTEVRALQEDENAKHLRIREDWKAGLLTREMALRELGYDPELAPDDTLMLPTGTSFVKVADAVQNPEKAPAAAIPEPTPQPGLPAGGQRPTAGGNPPASRGAKGLGDDFSELLQAVVDKAADGFAEDLQRLQTNQQKRLQRALVAKSQPVKADV